MTITCKFELSRNSNIYYSGDEIAGSLKICNFKQCVLEAIILEFYGQSTVQWWELDKSDENIMHNDFSTREISDKTLYYCQQQHVRKQLKLDSTNFDCIMQRHVEYTFKFCFTIPQQVPATFRCRYGQTDYGLRLQVQRSRKVNKEFHHKIIVKNKLDLTQEITHKKSCDLYRHNEFGEIRLQIPCSGFTPGQKIPYFMRYKATQNDCKVLIQFNCYTTCRTKNNCSKYKQMKKIVSYKKHLSGEVSSCISIPLNSHISSTNELELLLSTQYSLEAFVVQGNKRVLLSAVIPIIIGTTPCYMFDTGLENYTCYDNYGSCSHESSDTKIVNFSNPLDDQLYESFYNLSIKNTPKLRKSFRCFYKKLAKLI